MNEDAEPIICHSYTFARKFPLVIGKLSGWTPWWGPATPSQYAVGAGTALLLVTTKAFWAHLPGPLNLAVYICVPFGLAWYLRAARIEHRAPARALLGFLTLLFSPAKGTRGGRPYREPGAAYCTGNTIFVAELLPVPAGRRRARPGRGGA